MIKFKKVSKFYKDNTPAAKDLSFHIKPGEFVSIVGQSGTGKTTIAKMIIAEERASSGNINVGGWDISSIKNSEIPILRRQIGVVFQDFKLLPKKSVFENIAFAMEVCGLKQDKINKVVPQVLKIVGLENKADKFPGQLSGGEMQRVVIARSLIHHPKIIVADEPTGNLDSINAYDIVNLLLKINQFGTTVVLVTHNHDIVNSIKKRVITLDNGMIISDQKSGKYIL
ncbi:MAG: cell division ATP-binding protein FtsE [Patescibacteria group bacterium]